jgi:hypothetical protein
MNGSDNCDGDCPEPACHSTQQIPHWPGLQRGASTGSSAVIRGTTLEGLGVVRDVRAKTKRSEWEREHLGRHIKHVPTRVYLCQFALPHDNRQVFSMAKSQIPFIDS